MEGEGNRPQVRSHDISCRRTKFPICENNGVVAAGQGLNILDTTANLRLRQQLHYLRLTSANVLGGGRIWK